MNTTCHGELMRSIVASVNSALDVCIRNLESEISLSDAYFSDNQRQRTGRSTETNVGFR